MHVVRSLLSSGPPVHPLDKYFVKLTKYHYYYFSLYLISKLATVWPTLNIVFISPHSLTYTCGDKALILRQDPDPVDPPAGGGGGGGGGGGNMVNKCPCKNPVWDTSVFTYTVQMKYNVICEKKYLIEISETVTFFGLLVGSMLFGYLADKFGRLITFVFSNIVVGIFGILTIFLPNMYVFIVVRFIQGCGCGGALVTGFVLCMEYCGPTHRGPMGSLLHLPTNIGMIMMAGVSYLLRDYRYFQVAVSIPSILYGFLYFMIYESPKWTLNFDKPRTLKIMKKFCAFNNNPCPTLESDIASFQGTQEKNVVRFYKIFSYRHHTINFILLSYIWFVCGMCFYGLSVFIGRLTIYPHMNIALNGVFTGCGTIFCIFTVNHVGRKPLLATVNLCAGLCIIGVILFPESMKDSPVKVGLACFANCLYYIDFIVIYIYSVELLPTNIRNSIFGMMSMICRIGQMLGPSINSLTMKVAGCIFGVCGIIAFAVCLFLPETRGIALMTTLEESPPPRTSCFTKAKPST